MEEAADRRIAIEYSGGWEYLKETSDVSLDTVEDLSGYLYSVYSTNEHFKDALEATGNFWRCRNDHGGSNTYPCRYTLLDNLPDTVDISHVDLDKGTYKLKIHYLNEIFIRSSPRGSNTS